VAVALRSPVWWVAVAVHLLVFRNAAGEVLRHDLPALPDGLNRLAHEGKARRQIRLVAQRRRAECRSGPVALGDDVRSGRRWVFVVCGGALHIDTLRTAVAHLRPLTSLEIWVVTDSRRNVHPIDTDGVDRVVDVATPAELDDHQASIWLKTSVHRHVPPGEWCYLDSDIIAVRPGMEQVFEHRRGPVAFAPDLTISVNRVDRFSPWAMNCDCSGYGDRHSCSHLREQIALRLGVEVPRDWVHWNGGVFVFGPDSGDFLDLWHRTAIESFSWPEWRTRDQGALIATVWRTGHQELVGLPQAFNFIADLGNGDLCLEAERGWALHPQGPWHEPYLLHCYTSSLELEDWDLGRDVEAPVVRQTVVRVQRWRRWVALQRGKEAGKSAYWSGMERWWVLKDRLNLYRIRTVHQFRRLRPGRMLAAVRRRRGTLDDGWDPSPPDPPGGRGSAEQDATAPASIQGRAS
jgi:hypothetical protein